MRPAPWNPVLPAAISVVVTTAVEVAAAAVKAMEAVAAMAVTMTAVAMAVADKTVGFAAPTDRAHVDEVVTAVVVVVTANNSANAHAPKQKASKEAFFIHPTTFKH